ncbi:MAG: hypothetical protein GY930_02480 [bacterium]|nr:hypothetical protein [bacterium]
MVSLIGWVLAFCLGLFARGVAESSCLEKLHDSDPCAEPWLLLAEDIIINGVVALSAWFVVQFAVLAASASRKKAVANVSFASGTSVVVYLAMTDWRASTLIPMGAAVLAKALARWYCLRRIRTREANRAGTRSD